MGSFEKAVAFTLEKEGVFSNDVADRGGKTRFGIIESELVQLQSFGKFPGRRIEDLTRAEAVEIYRSDYWRYDDVASDMIATKLFDIGVNMGPKIATLIVQRALNFFGSGQPLTEDGVWGPLTLDAVNLFCHVPGDALKLYKAMTLFQTKRYIDIVLSDHTQLSFIDGWIHRAGTRPT